MFVLGMLCGAGLYWACEKYDVPGRVEKIIQAMRDYNK